MTFLSSCFGLDSHLLLELSGLLLLAAEELGLDRAEKGREASSLGFHHIGILPATTCKCLDPETVDVTIGLMTLDVLVAVLGHGDGQNGKQGQHGDAWVDCSELREELKNNDKQKEEVGNTTELFKQVLEDKVVDGIFGGQDLVAGEEVGVLGMPLGIKGLLWKGLIEVDGARSRWWSLLFEYGIRIKTEVLELGAQGCKLAWFCRRVSFRGNLLGCRLAKHVGRQARRGQDSLCSSWAGCRNLADGHRTWYCEEDLQLQEG